jgi:formylglycine-generating enzyme required for sulfatase activity
MNHDVFISYSSQDVEAAQAICHVLEQNEIRCWMAPRNIPPGSDYGDVIDDAIKSCKVVVILYSKKAASSPWVTGELNVAFEEQKTIIPFRLDKTPLKGQTRVMLNQRHWIDAYPDYKTKFNDLVRAVALTVGKDVQIDAPPVKPSVQLKKYKKTIIFGLTAAIVIGLITVLCLFIARQMHSYIYDKQGLHVNTRGLASQQEEALTAILDDMVLIDGGKFMMGNTPEMEDYLTEQDSFSTNVHEVELDNYYICKYEVTQKQWRAFLPTEGKCIVDGDNTAMDKLSWEDAKAFADTLSVITGLQFALPTEAQWEFAARGGNKTRRYVFSGHAWDATEVGWTSFEELTSAHEVGGKRYNELGLYDMTGNVFEWCYDFYEPYSLEKQINPQGPSKGSNHVLRGGDFRIDNLNDLKVSTRYYDAPFVNRKGAGLRLVINIKK